MLMRPYGFCAHANYELRFLFIRGFFPPSGSLRGISAAQQRARMALKSRSNEEPETPVPSLKTSLVFCSL